MSILPQVDELNKPNELDDPLKYQDTEVKSYSARRKSPLFCTCLRISGHPPIRKAAGGCIRQANSGSVWWLCLVPLQPPIFHPHSSPIWDVKNHQLRFNCFPKKVYNPHHSNLQKVDGSVFPTATATGGSLKRQPPVSQPVKRMKLFKEDNKISQAKIPSKFH